MSHQSHVKSRLLITTANINTTNMDEFLEQFRTISNKLKKRFLRKPNVTEASQAFSILAQQCEHADMHAHAGMCWIASARCEGSLGNSSTEVTCLLRAARQFIATEATNQAIGCPGVAEHLQAALSCYVYACMRCPDLSSLSRGINLEIAENLPKIQSIQYIKTALNQSKTCFDSFIHIYDTLASKYIQTGDYTSALVVYTEMAAILDAAPCNGVKIDLLLNCEINRIFLLLILRPTAQRLSSSLAKLLEKYMWGDLMSTKVFGMSEDMFLLLQSLVMTCQSQDVTCLPEIEQDLWPFLNTELRELLRVLVKNYYY